MKLTPSILLILSSFFILPVSAQHDAADIYKKIKKFGVLANVLYVAAHPDDENTRLISYLSNHLSARTTYLSITRGDGGQNLIGPEMREMLGVIRTHELLEARKIDGGFQMFTRANDFGYSKSAAETFNIWDRREVLSDVVWAIRRTRPDVIINRFNTDTIRPNHGHHTASAILSVEAFELANDKSAFPEQLKHTDPWQPHRIFWNTSWWFYGSRENFEKADKSRMVTIDIGAFDQIMGESNSEIAGRSRSMHKSQGFGSAETRGESLDYIDLLKDINGQVPSHLFDGIDITWNRVQGGARLADLSRQLDESFDFKAPSKSLPLLMEIHRELRSLSDPFWREIKMSECEQLIVDCLGLFVEMRTGQFQASPGVSLPVTLEVINRSEVDVMLRNILMEDENILAFDTMLPYNKSFVTEVAVTVPDELSIPYWLEEKASTGMFKVPDQMLRGMPADRNAIINHAEFSVLGESIYVGVPIVYRTIDPAEGEVYRPLFITPPVTITRDAEVMILRMGNERMIELTLTAMQDSTAGSLDLVIDAPGWKVTPSNLPWSFTKKGESISVGVTVTPPALESKATLRPVILSDGLQYHHTVATIDYDHLPYMSIVRDATMELKSVNIKTTPRSIAYIEGAGDDVVEGLEQLGYEVDVLAPGNISLAQLNKYQVIMLGVRAFNTVEELAYKNKILFDWVKAGGTLIVQYNTHRDLVTEEIAPYPLTLSRDRVTEENSPVSMLTPEHSAMRYPNLLSLQDFDGWIQERGLYFPGQWDENFTPLLEMNDTGEKSTKGSLLVAPYGEGFYVYSGLSWFRHLPAGVPGAYRLLSNIISLGYKNNKS
jgi:LmbE family N-acetylglucosaminyl deacetylase